MATDDLTFQFVPAVASGLIAGTAVLFAMVTMLTIMPVRFPHNPVYIIGSAFSIDTTTAYASGFAVILLSGAAYGIVISAVLTGFQAESLEFVWGGFAGLALSVVSGTTLAYSRSLNRSIRAGQVGDPGPFLIRYGGWSVAQFIASHVLFGIISGIIYAGLT